MVNFMVLAVIIAAIATLIAVAAAYWYVFVGIGLVAYGIYVAISKKKQADNKV